MMATCSRYKAYASNLNCEPSGLRRAITLGSPAALLFLLLLPVTNAFAQDRGVLLSASYGRFESMILEPVELPYGSVYVSHWDGGIKVYGAGLGLQFKKYAPQIAFEFMLSPGYRRSAQGTRQFRSLQTGQFVDVPYHEESKMYFLGTRVRQRTLPFLLPSLGAGIIAFGSGTVYDVPPDVVLLGRYGSAIDEDNRAPNNAYVYSYGLDLQAKSFLLGVQSYHEISGTGDYRGHARVKLMTLHLTFAIDQD